jgi:hypothetical protein
VSTLSVSGTVLTETSDLSDPNGATMKAVSIFDKQ